MTPTPYGIIPLIITPTHANFGTYFILTGTAVQPLTITFPTYNSATSNLGKFWTIRNNTGTDLTTNFSVVTNVTAPANTVLFSNTSMTLVLSQVLTPNIYSLF